MASQFLFPWHRAPPPFPFHRFLLKPLIPTSRFCTKLPSDTENQSTYLRSQHESHRFVSAWASPQPSLRQIQQNDDVPSSANAIVAAVNAVASSIVEFCHRTDTETKELFSSPSEDFLELCNQQLVICDGLFGGNTKFTVYVRPAESYGTSGLEFRRLAAHPKSVFEEYDGTVVIVSSYDTTGILRSAELALLEREAMELPKHNALVLPMVKDFFLVGVLVAELMSPRPQEMTRVKALRPEWPPRQGLLRTHQQDATEKSSSILSSCNTSNCFSQEQQSHGKRIAQSLAIACVMDQRTLLLQQSSWQRGVHIGDLLEKVRGPLAAIRTLGRILQPQLNREEISSDVLKDILVQGEHMKSVLEQFQEVFFLSKNPANILQNKTKPNLLDAEFLKNDASELLQESDICTDSESAHLNSSSPGYSCQKDREAPMPPMALAPLMHADMKSCDVSKLLFDLVSSGSVLAGRKGKVLKLRQNPQDAPYIAAIDESLLRQAFSNLLEGSLQHILPGGWVKVEVSHAPGGGVLVVIDNNGPDLSLMSQTQVLAPWGSGVQVPTTGKEVIFNIGTEFTVARDLLEQYGAVLRITSPYLPKAPSGMGGTRLEAWLPCPSTKEPEM